MADRVSVVQASLGPHLGRAIGPVKALPLAHLRREQRARNRVGRLPASKWRLRLPPARRFGGAIAAVASMADGAKGPSKILGAFSLDDPQVRKLLRAR